MLAQQSPELAAGGLAWEVDEAATHNEAAWAARLPRALHHLLAPWWAPTAARSRGSLYFTLPRRLKGGQPAVLYFNQVRAALRCACGKLLARSTVHVAGGTNTIIAASQPDNRIC